MFYYNDNYNSTQLYATDRKLNLYSEPTSFVKS